MCQLIVFYRKAIEQEKIIYKESFDKLRVLKPEIENIRKLLENLKTKIQSQFDEWYNNLHSRNIYDDNNNSQSKSVSIAETKPIISNNNTYQTINNKSQSKSDDVNDDINAFFQAKDELLKRKNNNR